MWEVSQTPGHFSLMALEKQIFRGKRFSFPGRPLGFVLIFQQFQWLHMKNGFDWSREDNCGRTTNDRFCPFYTMASFRGAELHLCFEPLGLNPNNFMRKENLN